VATVDTEGVPFELDDAARFGKRLDRASYGTSKAGLSPARALAIEIEEAVDASGGAVAIREEAREIAFAVLDEWYPTAPESARRLRRFLGQ
jgi:hypothetical protein